MPSGNIWTYEAKLIDVHDGDTATFCVNLGFRVTFTDTFRLRNVNAWEISTGEKGIAAREYLKVLLGTFGESIQITTFKNKAGQDRKEKYGRWLWDARISSSEEWFSRIMMNRGHGVWFPTSMYIEY